MVSVECARFIVRGRVQGVGFRAFVQREAERLELRGEVWNRRDGGVELIAWGTGVSELEARLSMGPGRVASVERQSTQSDLMPDAFSIGPTR